MAPARVSDVIDGFAWRRSATFAECRRLIERSVYHLGIPLLPIDGSTTKALLVARSHRDFTDREVALARRAQALAISMERRAANACRHVPVGQPAGPDAGLTERELMVLHLLANGLTAAAIARRLGIRVATVSKHQEHLYRKLSANNRLSAVLAAQRIGVLETPIPANS